jgi:hypothetical protein
VGTSTGQTWGPLPGHQWGFFHGHGQLEAGRQLNKMQATLEIQSGAWRSYAAALKASYMRSKHRRRAPCQRERKGAGPIGPTHPTT